MCQVLGMKGKAMVECIRVVPCRSGLGFLNWRAIYGGQRTTDHYSRQAVINAARAFWGECVPLLIHLTPVQGSATVNKAPGREAVSFPAPSGGATT